MVTADMPFLDRARCEPWRNDYARDEDVVWVRGGD